MTSEYNLGEKYHVFQAGTYYYYDDDYWGCALLPVSKFTARQSVVTYPYQRDVLPCISVGLPFR